MGYVALYTGPKFKMEYLSSSILYITYVTAMFGFGIPYLFPVAVFHFAILYFVQKTLLYYSYRRPPMYDGALHDLVLKMLEGAPVFYLAFGYWMCSS